MHEKFLSWITIQAIALSPAIALAQSSTGSVPEGFTFTAAGSSPGLVEARVPGFAQTHRGIAALVSVA